MPCCRPLHPSQQAQQVQHAAGAPEQGLPLEQAPAWLGRPAPQRCCCSKLPHQAAPSGGLAQAPAQLPAGWGWAGAREAVVAALRAFLSVLARELSPADPGANLPLPATLADGPARGSAEVEDQVAVDGEGREVDGPVAAVAGAVPLGDGSLVLLSSRAFGRYCSVSIDATLLCWSPAPSNASRNLFLLSLAAGGGRHNGWG